MLTSKEEVLLPFDSGSLRRPRGDGAAAAGEGGRHRGARQGRKNSAVPGGGGWTRNDSAAAAREGSRHRGARQSRKNSAVSGGGGWIRNDSAVTAREGGGH